MAVGPRSGRVFASGGQDGFINLYSISDDVPVYKLGPFNSAISCCCFDHSEEYLAFGTVSGTVSIMDLDAGKTVASWSISQVNFTCLEFHPQIPDVVVAGDSSGRVYVFGSSHRFPMQRTPAHRGKVNAVTVCPQGDLLATCGADRCIRIIHLPTGELRATIKPSCLEMLSICFHPIHRVLAGCSRDRRVHLFDVDTCCEIADGLMIGSEPPERVKFVHDGSVVACCSASVVSMFRTEAPEFADHMQISLPNMWDMQLFSTGVSVASSSGGSPTIVMARTKDFRLLKHEEEKKIRVSKSHKVIDGSNLSAPTSNNRVKRREGGGRMLIDLQPKKEVGQAAAVAVNEGLYKLFKNDRAAYLATLSKRLARMTHIKDMIKRKGFVAMATEVAKEGEGIEELMTVLANRPETIKIENAAAVIDALQFGFHVDAGQALNILKLVLEAVGESVETGSGEDAKRVIMALHGIAPVVSCAADQRVEGAQELLDRYNRLLM